MSKMSTIRSIPSTLAVGALAGSVLTIALFGGGLSQAAAALDEHEKLRLGTYLPQRAFEQFHGMQDFNDRVQRIQQQMQEAQQEGDQQRMTQLQQEIQQLQNQIVEQFHAEVEEVMPAVADDAGVELVAIEIAYAGDQFDKPKDITDKLIDKLNEEAGADTEPEPDLPW